MRVRRSQRAASTGRDSTLRSGIRGESGLGLVEVLVSVAILSIGVLAIARAGIQVGTQLGESRLDTEEALVARQVMDRLRTGPFAAIRDGTDTVMVGSRAYVVTRTVTSPTSRLKLVDLSISTDDPALAATASRVFSSRVHATRPLPVAP